VLGVELLVGETFRVGADDDHAAALLVGMMQRHHRERRFVFRYFQRQRRPGVIVHVPQIRTHHLRHRNAVAFVIRRA